MLTKGELKQISKLLEDHFNDQLFAPRIHLMSIENTLRLHSKKLRVLRKDQQRIAKRLGLPPLV